MITSESIPDSLTRRLPEPARQAEYGPTGFAQGDGSAGRRPTKLIDMNMTSMLSVHDRVDDVSRHFKRATRIVTASAVALALVFAGLIGRVILRPLRILTESVRQIELGNLDLVVPIKSADELGVLASAVNAMSLQIKTYRQADHDRLVRSERTTQLAIDSLPDAVIVLSVDGRIELANEAGRQLFGIVPGVLAETSGVEWLAETASTDGAHRAGVIGQRL